MAWLFAPASADSSSPRPSPSGDHRLVCAVERDPFAAEILHRRFGCWVWDDIHTYEPDFQPDILTAGLPCQPYSTAGKRRGDEDERALWPELVRIVEACSPRLIVLENVPGFLRFFRPVWERLHAMGYVFDRPAIVAAAAVGAGHRRRRLFLCGHAHDQGQLQPQRGESELGGRASDAGGWWSTEPGMARVVHGLPNRVDRERCLGNAVVPLAGAYAVRAVADHAAGVL